MGSPSRFAAFLAELAMATRRFLGADRVDLRTFGRLPASKSHVLGAAFIGSGHMLVGRDVPEFVEDLLARQGLVLVDDDLQQLRMILSTLVHECIHLALPHDFDPNGVATPLTPEFVFLEEGVTEATTQKVLPQVLAAQESTFPGISRSVPDCSGYYPNYVPAARELVSLVEALPEMRGRAALLELASVGPERKFDLLVGQAMEGFGLTFNVPARDRESVRSRIRAALEAHLQRNYHWLVPPDRGRPHELSTSEPEALSTIMGRQMGMELLRQLHAEGERVEMDLPEGWRQRLAAYEAETIAGLVRSDGFSGPESRQALSDWISRAEPPTGADVPRGRHAGREWRLRVGRTSTGHAPRTAYQQHVQGMTR